MPKMGNFYFFGNGDLVMLKYSGIYSVPPGFSQLPFSSLHKMVPKTKTIQSVVILLPMLMREVRDKWSEKWK